MDIQILETQPNDSEVIPLIEALSVELNNRFGSSGIDSFKDWDDKNLKFVFVKAISTNEVVGCGAIRPISNKVVELKRMYSKYSRKGIGKEILYYLENKAMELGFSEIWLETRKLNDEACSFYLKNGFKTIPNYGKYIGNEKAICFGKIITARKTTNS